MNKLIFVSILLFVTSAVLSSNEPLLMMWEDDYLMIELLPNKSKDEISNENKRLANFSRKNSNGLGYSNVTSIVEPKYKLKDLNLKTKDALEIIKSFNIPKLKYMNYQGVLTPLDDRNVYGDHNLAIFIEDDKGFISHVWLAKRSEESDLINIFTDALHMFGKEFDLLLNDYYQTVLIDLKHKEAITGYLTH